MPLTAPRPPFGDDAVAPSTPLTLISENSDGRSHRSEIRTTTTASPADGAPRHREAAAGPCHRGPIHPEHTHTRAGPDRPPSAMNHRPALSGGTDDTTSDPWRHPAHHDRAASRRGSFTAAARQRRPPETPALPQTRRPRHHDHPPTGAGTRPDLASGARLGPRYRRETIDRRSRDPQPPPHPFGEAAQPDQRRRPPWSSTTAPTREERATASSPATPARRAGARRWGR